MKICFIGDGQSIHIQRWISYFAKQKHEILLLTDNPGMNLSFPQEIIGKKKGNKLLHYKKAVKDIQRIIKKWKPDILHGHFISGYGYWTQMSGFHPYILTAWGSDIYIIPKKKKIAHILTRRALEQADLVTTDSEDLKSEILKLAPKTKKVEIILFGVDIDLFKPAVNPDKIKEQLGWKGKKIILSNRRLESNYNIDSIIKSFSTIRKEIQNTRLIILGNGKEKENLNKLVHSLKLTDVVEFHDEIEHPKLIQFLQASDLYISIPFHDGTSVSLLEAMSCEKPVIVSDIPSNREWIQLNKNGILVIQSSIDNITKSCIDILLNKELSEYLGKKNRQIILTRAEFSQEMKKMEFLYKNILNK